MSHAIALIFILTVEYIADFLLQTREEATKKSENFEYLLKHITVINFLLFIASSIVFSILWGTLAGILGGLLFSTINAIIHAITDWNIWKLYKYIVYTREKNKVELSKHPSHKYTEAYSHNMAIKHCERFKQNKEYAEDPWFYNIIGLDRLIHVSTIILLYFWFMKGV